MIDENRNDNGRFKKGNCANPNGRPKKPRAEKLEAAIEEVEQEQSKKLFKHFVERAFTSDAVLAVLFKKLLPDMRAIEANIVQDKLQENIRTEQTFIDEAIATGQALDDAPDAMAGDYPPPKTKPDMHEVTEAAEPSTNDFSGED